MNSLSARYEELQKDRPSWWQGRPRRHRGCFADLRQALTELQQREDLMRDLEMNLDTKKATLEELTYEQRSETARLAELEKMLDAQQKAVKALKDKVSDALFGFENTD